MRKLFIALQLLLFTGFASSTKILTSTNVFWGTDGGNVFPGVSVPFGMVKLGPEVRAGWQPTSGYRSDEPIVGFSHTRTSGTGGAPRYGNFLIVPQIDSMRLKELFKYTKLNEAGYPGYYTVTLKDKNSYIKAELTASQKVGYHRYTFTKKYSQTNALNANILIDVSNTLTRLTNNKPGTYWTDGYVKIVSSTELQASITCEGGWGGLNPYTVYCYMEFDKPFTKAQLWRDGEFINRKELATTNPEKLLKRFGAAVTFAGLSGMEVNCKVGLSFLSFEAAMLNLRSENNKSFEDALSTAENLWLEKLNKIQIKGGSVVAQQLFRSALRNTMLMPTNVTGEVPGWNPNVPHYWDYYCIWDIFRATMPLYTLIWPDKQREFIQNLLEIYKQRGYLPDAWIAGDYAQIQGGSNADVVLADAVVKKLGGFDPRLALDATLKNAEIQSDNPNLKGRYVNDYQKYGYVLPETTKGTVSRTLEYAYNDYCIAQIAKSLKESLLTEKYTRQSLRVFNLFHPEHKMFWAKDSVGNWMPDFSPVSKRKDHWNDPYFYEGGSQIYSTYLPHAMQTLIAKHGGNAEYIKYLDNLFDSGVFGIENEPEFLIPYQYIYAGDYPSTARRVHEILTKTFQPGTAGIPGQDDAGSMSAWYVWSAMGFFPVAGQDLYLIGTPLFEETTIQLENKKQLRISAKNVSSKNIYVTGATLNGRKLNRAWFRHSEIAKGGKLVFIMSDKPNDWGKENLPYSL
ncbi:MAG: Glycosyl hydrolase family 92 [Bacteroidetes bacterium ADurb.BinA395]|nr:MAG: Glycosyl hydrolase family 92 [Bacteroidetes bacterium ADurb.BinA395]